MCVCMPIWEWHIYENANLGDMLWVSRCLNCWQGHNCKYNCQMEIHKGDIWLYFALSFYCTIIKMNRLYRCCFSSLRPHLYGPMDLLSAVIPIHTRLRIGFAPMLPWAWMKISALFLLFPVPVKWIWRGNIWNETKWKEVSLKKVSGCVITHLIWKCSKRL